MMNERIAGNGRRDRQKKFSQDEKKNKGKENKFNPDFPLENNYVQVLHHGGPDALAHKPQNQARFFLGTDNSK